MGRAEYVEHPELIQVREGFSFLDLKRYVQGYRGGGFYRGSGSPRFERPDRAGAAHGGSQRPGLQSLRRISGRNGDRVLIADPAWGNRTMTIDKFQRMWLDYGEPMGHVGFVVTRADRRKPPNSLAAKPSEFVMLQ